MKATEKMISALKEMGVANEWHKGGMHRLYINLVQANEIYHDNNDRLEHGRLILNRYERMNGKMWVNLDDNEICSKGIDDEVIGQIIELVDVLYADAEETAEETYSVILSNSSAAFDEGDFATVEEAIKWAKGRGGSYVMQIEGKRWHESVAMTDDGKFSILGRMGWVDYTQEELIRRLKASL